MKLSSIDHIFCLNLPKRTDRASTMAERFKRVGLNRVEMFRAVNMDSIKMLSPTKMRPGNCACTISHLEIYHTALARGYKNIIVIEDDVLLHKNFVPLLNEYCLQVPDDWDVVYLAWIPVNEKADIWDYGIIRNTFITPNVFRANSLWSTMGYCVTDRYMKEITEGYMNGSHPFIEIDRYFVYNVQPFKRVYAFHPQLIVGYDGWSDCGDVNLEVFDRSHDNRITSLEDYV